MVWASRWKHQAPDFPSGTGVWSLDQPYATRRVPLRQQETLRYTGSMPTCGGRGAAAALRADDTQARYPLHHGIAAPGAHAKSRHGLPIAPLRGFAAEARTGLARRYPTSPQISPE